MYKLTKEGWLQIAARYDAKTRFALISYINKLEKATMPSYQEPDPIKRAELWIEERKQMLALEAENKILEPKADAYNVISNSNRLSTVTEIAGLFNMGRNTMYKWLRKNGYVMKHINKPYQKFIDAELFDWKVDRVNGMLHYVVLVTGKGILEIERKLQEEEL